MRTSTASSGYAGARRSSRRSFPGPTCACTSSERTSSPPAADPAAPDYRYAAQQPGRNAELREVELAQELSQRCVALAAALDLVFAGIDLKITPDDQVYCFEVNPSPAFSYYESATGQPIAEAIAGLLVSRTAA